MIVFMSAVILTFISCKEEKKYSVPDVDRPSPAYTVGGGGSDGHEDDESREASSGEEVMEVCPFCGGNGSGCGFCNGSGCGFCGGRGEVSAAMAAQARHVIGGGSVSDFYPVGGGSSDGYGSQPGSGRRDRMCPACDGRGTCPVCRGTGEVTNYGYTSVCDYCYSSGRCPKCMGNGLIPD